MMSTVSYAGKNIKWNSTSDANPVAEKLDKTKEVRCLKLEANTLGVEAAKVIGDALAKHPEFERAHWKDLFTGRLKTEIPQALKNLFSGIMRANAKLIELDLSDNALGPIGVEGIVNFIKSPSCYSLQELRLNNNGLGIKGGTMLAEALMQLAENASKAGTSLKLKVFICGRNRLENKGAHIFAKFFSIVKTLEEVMMPQNGIFHEGIAALAKSFSLNPHLRILNLNDNTFTPKGAKAMAAELVNMVNLESINFGDCLIKTPGALAIASALQENHLKLQELYLDSNEITAEGGIAIVEALGNKPAMRHLMLDTNVFGEDGAEFIMGLLNEIGKGDILGPLDENEEPDDEEDEDENSEDDDNESEEVEEEEEEELDSTDEFEEEGAILDDPAEGVSPLNRMVFKTSMKCSPEEFIAGPTETRLLELGEEAPIALVEAAKRRANNLSRDPDQGSTGSPEAQIHELFQNFMVTSSLVPSTNKQIESIVGQTTKRMLVEALTVAEKNELVSVATNCFLVHLGLIKSEHSKNFKVTGCLKGAMISLEKIISENPIPVSVGQTLKLFLSRPCLLADNFPEEKKKLLSSLGGISKLGTKT